MGQRRPPVDEAIRRSEVLVYALGVDGEDRVDTRALRKLTDDTGGRTEVVKGFTNLKEATGRLADELVATARRTPR